MAISNKRSKRVRIRPGGKYFEEDLKIQERDFIGTGSVLLDLALGGGWAGGRISNIVGDKSSGKTLLGIEACANFHYQNPEGLIFYMESESAFDKAFAKSLGMPIDAISFIEDALTIEEFFVAVEEAVSRCTEGGVRGLFILDSLDALSDKAEMGRGIDEGSYNLQKAKKLSEMFRRLSRKIGIANLHLMIISQVRDNIGATFGRKTKRAGGKALDFYASQVLHLAELKKIFRTIKSIKRATGIHVRGKVDKNKVGMPFRECDFIITFGYGIDSVSTGLNFLATTGDLSKVNRTLKKDNLTRYVTSTDKMTDKEYKALQLKIDKLCRIAWARIEEGFKPTRTKYSV